MHPQRDVFWEAIIPGCVEGVKQHNVKAALTNRFFPGRGEYGTGNGENGYRLCLPSEAEYRQNGPLPIQGFLWSASSIVGQNE